ncbi:DUF4019 domain-containing protein [Massilia sp. UYP11]|uniref:DUF4019 domain-containing protein n=1 Tax=Massilia sp. UYP11 TaxID=1756385 RepID=UPI003D1E3D4D
MLSAFDPFHTESAMKQLAPIALAMMFALPVAAVHAQETEHSKAGVAAAGHWLALADASKAAETWSSAGAVFRAAVTAEQWSGMLAAARAPLGELASRTLANARHTRTLPGAPEADYVVIQYGAVYANRPGVTETVVTTREADGWKVITYLIQ